MSDAINSKKPNMLQFSKKNYCRTQIVNCIIQMQQEKSLNVKESISIHEQKNDTVKV